MDRLLNQSTDPLPKSLSDRVKYMMGISKQNSIIVFLISISSILTWAIFIPMEEGAPFICGLVIDGFFNPLLVYLMLPISESLRKWVNFVYQKRPLSNFLHTMCEIHSMFESLAFHFLFLGFSIPGMLLLSLY